MKRTALLIPVIIAILTSCSPSPRPIDYALEHCAFCKMTVVETMYGSELVTSKGKIYVFDAIECMIHFQDKNPGTNFAFEMVTHYGHPAELANAESSYFLISPSLPSPMGANLTAFRTLAEVQNAVKTFGGEVHDWNSVKSIILDENQAQRLLPAAE